MRLLLSLSLCVLATALTTHGVYFHEAANAELYTQGSGEGQTVTLSGETAQDIMSAFPYTEAAVACRGKLAAAWAGEDAEARPIDEMLGVRLETAFSETAPWVDPYGAALVALGALLLVLFLPRQRFRSFALLLFLLGGVALFPSFLDEPQIGDMVAEVGFTEHVVSHFPWIATGLLFAAAFLAGSQRPHRLDHYDD